MALSDLRLHVHSVFAVNPDGTEGELLEQTYRYGDIIVGKAFSSVEEALLSAGVIPPAEPVAEELPAKAATEVKE